jgi:hypothetical protein
VPWPTHGSRIDLRVCSVHISRTGTTAIRIASNVAMYGPASMECAR